jgi:copper homeostasis protein
LIETGINRILSSGLSSSVELGLPILAEMMNYAKSRIEIMVGGGVNLGNIQRILLDVQPDAIHFSGTSKLILDENSYFSETLLQLDKSKVEKLIHSIRG